MARYVQDEDMRKILLVIALVATSIVFAPGSAFACSCIEPQSDAVAEKGSDAVFAGTVTGYEITKPIGGEYEPAVDDVRMALEVSWTLSVDTFVKGEPAEEISVTSSGQGAACGFHFNEGERYLVFAYEDEQDDGGLSTNSCTNTRSVDPDKHIPGTPIEELALPEVPPNGMPQPTENPWPQIATLALGVVAAILIGRRFVSPSEERP